MSQKGSAIREDSCFVPGEITENIIGWDAVEIVKKLSARILANVTAARHPIVFKPSLMANDEMIFEGRECRVSH
jgi:hypothetical protein